MKTDTLLLCTMLAGLLLTACYRDPGAIRPTVGESGGGPVHAVYVANHGWHTGVIIPAGDINVVLPALHTRFGGSAYCEFGWGDAAYYQAREKTAGLAMRALFWPTDTVMHVAAVPHEPETYFSGSDVIKIFVTKDDAARLREFIRRSFRLDADGNPQPLGGGAYGDSQFYRAVGTFFFTNTCNKWTARALQSAGLDVSTAFNLTAGSLMQDLRRAASRQALKTPAK